MQLKNNNMKHLILFFLLSVFTNSIAQELEKEYYVFLLKKTNKKALHQEDTYLWVIPKDSIGLKSSSPLYIKGYSKTALSKCVEGKSPRLFMLSETDNWDFSEEEINFQKDLGKQLEVNQRKLFTLKITGKNFNEVIDINVIAIKGSLCKCPINNEEAKLIGFYNNIYLPLKNIKVIPFTVEELNISELMKLLPIGAINNTPY